MPKTIKEVPDKLPSEITSLNFMFLGASQFNQDLSTWDVSRVEDMVGTFANTLAFNQDISKWDSSKVVDMGYMFYKASLFNKDLSKWNVNEVLWHGWFAKNSEFENDPNKWPKFKN
ncbi:BspA family leucine-rich repeat surface protein [Spiroplasma endosymbiont of Danaus chrysippus]|uniref:BspA family leucine-rich repeat surface protein n=1 Tax=Spiroplasma endosymbiont of Danaus chrysippus TaxID=2691041 RepID=UPI00157AE342|nr:BspA family leucine-rich repeat surface protein [Spiroplasma endosymbiont of Danaus chrysippus]